MTSRFRRSIVGSLALTSLLMTESVAATRLNGQAPSSLDRGRYAVYIDLDERQLHFKQGELTLWSAPIGIGSGVRLISATEEWDFSTPAGVYEVEFKERDPVWIAPDWYFLENNLPVPEHNHPSRYIPGGLGSAAIYFHPTLAIHGTPGPGVGVSHGCIRLLDRDMLRLYHNVQVGTEVIIVGGEEARAGARIVDLRNGYDPSIAPRSRPPPPEDPDYGRWRRMPTAQLLEALDAQIALSRSDSRWYEPAVLLLSRVGDDDDDSLVGLLSRTANMPSHEMEREWATFLADAYRRAPVRTLESMSALAPAVRAVAAESIVSATLTLYRGELDAAVTPWPTRRIPLEVVTAEARAGWEALVAAEADFRSVSLAAFR